MNLQQLVNKVDYEGGLDYLFWEMRPNDLEPDSQVAEQFQMHWANALEDVVAMLKIMSGIEPNDDD